ncbi:hypothetical protein CW749_16890 [Vibrio sp. vnigr-6D03]|uniref:hypothetical protein n=1 Tax=Vibrio sp. vnigr-6D03 TaxID=2058088 RepID=UPI000C329B11|nr:hypothetical protein [Vibrio sp. vnigr-6D03]PKF78222.1 hypothetical protein CW749_16890 [Vibrio sp. vnigr-6D03]
MKDTRQYIRIDEVEKLFDLTKGQILDAVEFGDFELNVFVTANGVGGVNHNNDLLAIFDVKALVELSNSASRKLLDGEVRLKRFPANNILAVRNLSTANKRFPEALKGEFNSVKSTLPSEEELTTVVGEITAMMPSAESFKERFHEQFKPEEFKADSQGDAFLGALNGMNIMLQSLGESSKLLQSGYITLKPENIRLDKEKLNQYFGLSNRKNNGLSSVLIEDPSTVNETASSPEKTGLKPNIQTHPIKQIIFDVLSVYPQAKVNEVWNLIKRDSQIDSGRQFDKEGIVSEMTNDTLFYFGSEKERQVTYDYFRKKLFYSVKRDMKKTSP